MKRPRMCDVLLSALIAGVLYTACGIPEAPAQNVTCATRPVGDDSNACASTAFVQDSGGTIVASTLKWYVVGSATYPTAQSAVDAAVAVNGGVVWFPCTETALGSAAVGLNLNGARNVKLWGGFSLNSGGTACGAVRYTGTGIAIDISGSVGTEISGLEIAATSADYVIRATGAAQAAYARIHDNTIFGKTTATGIGISFDNIIISSVTSNTINAYVGMRGIDSVGATHTSNVVQIEKNSFTSGNTIHLQNATLWSVDKNTFTGSVSGVAYGQSAGVAGCSMINFSNNDFDDPQGGTLLINTDCKQVNSWGNVFSTMVGGTVFTLTAGADATLKSDGDYYNLNGVAININTGNCATMTNPRIGPLVTAVISGTAGCTNLSYVWQNTQQAGTLNLGVTSVFGGRSDYLGLTSGTASVRAQAAAGTPTILWPTTSGTLASSATSPLALDAGTGVLSISAIPLTSLATQATNTIVGNATSGSAAPTPLAIGSCSTSSSALTWTTNTGFGCNTAINAATLLTGTWAIPGTIGSTTPNTGAFTALTASTSGTFGNTTSPDSTLTVNNNNGAPDAVSFGAATAHFVSADTTLSGIYLDNYGTGGAAQGYFAGRLAGGTRASKTATIANQTAFSFFGQSWDGSAYATNAAIDFVTLSAQTGSDHSGYINFRTTPAGSTALTQAGRVHGSGGLSIGTTTDPGIGAIRANTTIKATTGFILTNLISSSTAPTATTFCTSPSIPANNGTAAFTINVGTSCGASTGTVTLPAAATGWVCNFHNVTTPGSNIVEMTGGTTTTVTLTNYARTTGLASNWTDSHIIRAMCAAY